MTGAPTTPDPIEIAMEAEASGVAPRPGVASELLGNQNRLVKWQIAKERAGYWLRVLGLVTAAVAAAGVGVVIWNASQAGGFVIAAIEAPPHLVAQGYTGKALAAQLQDGLVRIDEQVETRERAASAEVRGTDSGVKIEIPNTGVSLDQVDQFLRGWLGHETPVSGELVDIRDGPEAGALALTLRQPNGPGVRVVSKDRDVAALVQAGAERVYGGRYPSRFLSWMREHGRATEGAALAREYATRRWYNARAAGLVYIAGEPSTPAREALALRWQAAKVFGNESWGGWGTLALTEEDFGHAELALKVRRRNDADTARAKSLTPEGKRFALAAGAAGIALTLGDLRPVRAYACAQFSVEPCGLDEVVAAALARRSLGNLPQAAFRFAQAHDTASAARLLATAPDGGRPQGRLRAQVTIAVEREDWAGVLALADRSDALAREFPNFDQPNRAAIWRPLALAKLGRGAEAVAQPPPVADCYDCLVARAVADTARRDWAAADRGFTAAERLGPSLNRVQVERARMRLAKGDAAGAIALVKAVAKAPGQADALMVWGEALAAQGEPRGAAAKFREVVKIAPWWDRPRAELVRVTGGGR